MAKGWLDNFGKEGNYNDYQTHAPKGFQGDGYSNVGRNYSPAWGGQFQGGGKLKFLQPTDKNLPEGYVIPYNTPSTERAISIGGEDGEPAYLIPSFKYGKPLNDPMGEFRKTGEHLGGPFKTWQEADKWENETRHPAVEKGENIMFPQKEFQMGGVMPGAVGHMYARTGAPSEGKYAKKTLPSAQYGLDSNKLQPPPKSIGKPKDVRKKGDIMKLQSMYNTDAINYVPTVESLEGLKNPNLSPIESAATDQFVDWYSHPETLKRTEAAGYDPARVKDFIAAGLTTPMINSKSKEYKGAPLKYDEQALYKDPYTLKHNDIDLKTADKFKQGYITYNPDSKDLQNILGHELGHAAHFDNLFASSLYRALDLKLPEKIHGGLEYMDRPEEVYGNFHEMRLQMGLKPGQKIDYKTLDNKMKDNKIPNNFWRNFSTDPKTGKPDPNRIKKIVKAINTVAHVDTPQQDRSIQTAQNGKEMQYYQEGLDWQPKTISQNGSYHTGDKVTYGTPEYREAYDRGEVVTKEGEHSPIALPEVVIRGKKKDKNWLEQYASKIAEENRDAGPLGAIIGTPISAITSLPQLMGMKALTGEMQRPSEGLDIKNPYGAMAIDAVADPANLIGAGELSGLSKLGKEKALAKLAASKESGLLSHAHELNPWAFKANPESSYRMLGDKGLQDLQQSGIVRPNPEGYFTKNNPYPYFSRGEVLDQYGGKDMLEITNHPMTKNNLAATSPHNDVVIPRREIKLDNPNLKVYQKDWLQGYKEVPQTERQFIRNIVREPMASVKNTTDEIGLANIRRLMAGRHNNTPLSKELEPYISRIENSKTEAYTPFQEDEYIKWFNEQKNKNINVIQDERSKLKRSSIIDINNMEQGGVIKDDRGQWDHPGEITEIGSNDITMQGVPYDVLGISDTGDTKLMKPGKNYKFKGKKVTEYPMAKNGLRQEQKGLQNLDNLTNFTNYNTKQPGGWLDTL